MVAQGGVFVERTGLYDTRVTVGSPLGRPLHNSTAVRTSTRIPTERAPIARLLVLELLAPCVVQHLGDPSQLTRASLSPSLARSLARSLALSFLWQAVRAATGRACARRSAWRSRSWRSARTSPRSAAAAARRTAVSDLPCNIKREGGQSLVIGGSSLVILEGKACNPL